MTRPNYSGNPVALTIGGEPAFFCRSCSQVRAVAGSRMVYPKSNSRYASKYRRCAPCEELRSPRRFEQRVELTRT
jgi:hypothetical protein